MLLVLSLTLAAGLAYQAVDAAQSDRETVESVLRGYARIAAWEFSRRAHSAVSGAIAPSFRPRSGMSPPAPGAPVPPPEVIDRALAIVDDCSCTGLDRPSFVFRLGTHSFYTIPGQDAWEVVINRSVYRDGVPIDADVRAQDVGRGRASVEQLERHVERLTFDVRPTGPGSAELWLEWEMTRVRIPVERIGGS